MPDVQEVFRMATEKVKPDPNALERQLRRQRRSSRGTRTKVYLTVAVVVAAVAIGLIALQRSMGDTATPGVSQSTPASFATTLPVGATPQNAQIVDLSGNRTSGVAGLSPSAYALSYVPDAHEIAFIAATDAEQDVVGVLDTRTGEARIVPTPPDLIIGSAIVIGSVALSPDGSQVAFEAVSDGNTDIYVANIDGTDLLRLTDDPASDLYPQWSPDGSVIVYDNSGRNEDTADPQFSKNGEIYVVPASGTGQPTRLTNDKVDDNAPAFSPDGRQIAYFHGGEIWGMSRSGADQHQILGDGKGGFTPRWSPDGSKIAFTTCCGPHHNVALGTWYTQHPSVITAVLDVKTGTVTHLAHVGMATDYNVPQWTDNDHLLVLRVPTH
jgi:Tol biopolymer transport system component